MNILELAILKKMVGGGGGSGTDNYNDLSNLPQINGETLAGNKTAENLGLQDALTFDSTPTEDSANPVESGGVYNALAGKQDNLTFDDDPTENSTNPVKSGGVYSALGGKQDNLTFDGVYNASTNKAATESTVTNAIAGLDVSALSVDADETISSISETDGKVSVTKQDIAIASNQVVAMTGYTKPSSAPATPAIQQGDTANEAMGKLEYKADVNQTNISSVQNDVNILKLSEFNNAFGMKISKSDTNPDTKVSYMFNAEGMTPAHMDFTGGSFNFGSFSSWKPVSQNRPVGLNFDGSVAYELNHTDFSKKLDGTASDITDATKTINFMSEMPLMYVRRWEDENYNYIVFCEYQTNENYTADAFKNASGGIGSKLYLPMFKGSYVDGKLRSLAKQYWQNNADVQGTEAEWNAAAACGTGWQTWDWAKREYLSDLMTFITKSTDWKNKFGRGVTNRSTSNNNKYDGQPTGGYCSTSGDLTTWTADYHGQFYGVASATSDKKHVTAFYVEDPYGNRWERTPGLELCNNVYRAKMSPPYALTDSASRAEYDNLGISAPAEGWFKTASTSMHGSVPVAVGASETTGYCSYFYKNASSVRLALFGGACNHGGLCGRFVYLNFAPSLSYWFIGASPCFVSP